MTAKWHRAYQEGILNSRDGADEFRGALAKLQDRLREFAGELQILAYGATFPDIVAPPVFSPEELEECLGDLRFGIVLLANIANAAKPSMPSTWRRPKRSGSAEGFAGTSLPTGSNAVGLVFPAAASARPRSVSASPRCWRRAACSRTSISVDGFRRRLHRQLSHRETWKRGAGRRRRRSAWSRPGPIRYLRHHAKYLTALRRQRSLVHGDGDAGRHDPELVGTGLPGCAAALAAAWLGISHEAPGWPVVLAVLGLLTTAALVLYGYLMWTGPESARFSGDLLGGLAAATALLAIGWLIAAGYHVIPAWIALYGFIAGGLGALAVIGPAVLRSCPCSRRRRCERSRCSCCYGWPA